MAVGLRAGGWGTAGAPPSPARGSAGVSGVHGGAAGGSLEHDVLRLRPPRAAGAETGVKGESPWRSGPPCRGGPSEGCGGVSPHPLGPKVDGEEEPDAAGDGAKDDGDDLTCVTPGGSGGSGGDPPAQPPGLALPVEYPSGSARERAGQGQHLVPGGGSGSRGRVQGALPSPLLTPGEGREHQALVQLLRGPEIVHKQLGLLRLGLLRGIKASLELLQLEGEGAALRACSPKAGGSPERVLPGPG